MMYEDFHEEKSSSIVSQKGELNLFFYVFARKTAKVSDCNEKRIIEFNAFNRIVIQKVYTKYPSIF